MLMSGSFKSVRLCEESTMGVVFPNWRLEGYPDSLHLPHFLNSLRLLLTRLNLSGQKTCKAQKSWHQHQLKKESNSLVKGVVESKKAISHVPIAYSSCRICRSCWLSHSRSVHTTNLSWLSDLVVLQLLFVICVNTCLFRWSKYPSTWKLSGHVMHYPTPLTSQTLW